MYAEQFKNSPQQWNKKSTSILKVVTFLYMSTCLWLLYHKIFIDLRAFFAAPFFHFLPTGILLCYFLTWYFFLGFATYVANIGMESVLPEAQMRERVLYMDCQSVMGIDALESSHPILNTVINPSFDGQFDKITYR